MGDLLMEFVHEVTAYLENKPGRLAKICSALAKEKVDVRALSVMETDGPSVLRMITTHLDTTKNVLTSLGTEFRTAEVLAVPLENRTGSLAKVLEKLAEEHINVEYAYASTTFGSRQGAGCVPHLEPKTGRSDPERSGELRLELQPVRRAVGRCIRGELTTIRSIDFQGVIHRGPFDSEIISTVAKKKKVRVALWKNRQNRTRQRPDPAVSR